MPEKPITKEYLEKRFREYQADMHTLTVTLMDNARVYYEEESRHNMGAFKEGFIDEMRGTPDQVKSLNDKTDVHDARICKLKEMCYK